MRRVFRPALRSALPAGLRAVGFAAVVSLGLAACSGSNGGAKSASTFSSPANALRTSSAATARAIDPAVVAAKLEKAVPGITSAQAALAATFLGQPVALAGPAKFDGGRVVGLDLKGSIGGLGTLRVLLDGADAYAQVPASLNSTGKPWLRVSAASSSTIVAALGSVLGKLETAASLTTLVDLVRAASTVTDLGPATVDGAGSEHYSFVVDAAKLPGGFPNRTDFAGPLKDSPTGLWLDASGRPVKVTRTLLVSGSKTDVSIGLNAFGTAVRITPPPASEVGG
jgi:hypothetical protein